VEVKVGIQMAARELVVETAASPDDIEQALSIALADGTLFVLNDSKGGKTLLIPSAKIAYVELGTAEQRKIGFGAS
jgi:hypothetical protein